MRRIFVMLLVLLLPLQFAFAAAAGICAWEKKGASTHFGHHAHSAGAQGSGGDKDPSTVETDCGICHLAGSQIFAAPVVALGLESFGQERPSVQAPPLEHLIQPLDRPPRSVLA